MCRKITYHKPCGHVTAKYQHRPCPNGQYCHLISQELNSDRRCAGCRDDAATIIEQPIGPTASGPVPGLSGSSNRATDANASTTGGATYDQDGVTQQRESIEWFKRYMVDRIFDDGILVAQIMDFRAQELRESRDRRAERAQRRGFGMDADEADSFKWVPKKWWRNIWKWRTRPSMYLDGENAHSEHCGCCHSRRTAQDDFHLAFRLKS
ncbi:hypothetical protein TWF281_006697 [Arthrobotrys megalospora]